MSYVETNTYLEFKQISLNDHPITSLTYYARVEILPAESVMQIVHTVN
jgi:hypothetical protein